MSLDDAALWAAHERGRQHDAEMESRDEGDRYDDAAERTAATLARAAERQRRQGQHKRGR